MKRIISILLICALFLGGCSSYYQPDAEEETTEKPEERTKESSAIEAAKGPGGGVSLAGDATVESLETGNASSGEMNPEIIIGTDIHYLAKELTDFGEAFEEMAEHEDGKVVPYIWEITDAFLDAVIERKPQALLLTGDLALNGERLSHEALAQKLARVEKAGIDVLVIPGNHDINHPDAASYQGSTRVPAEQTSPREFEQIYANYGYNEAISRDSDSLSYLYELDDGTWLLMLDSCQYEYGNFIGGMIRSETYEWMEVWLEKAFEENRNVIAVAHHNLLDESRIYEDDCTIEHAEQLERMLDDWGVTLFLSGHLHVQHYRASKNYDIQEIVTGSLAIWPCQYGVLKYFSPKKYDYHTERVDVKGWAARHDNPDANLEDFDEYAKEFLHAVFYDQAYQALIGEVELEEDVDMMADFYAYMNEYSVSGQAVEIRSEAVGAWEYELWHEYSRTDIMSQYLDEIIEDAVYNYNKFQRDDE